jgi:hypothetical protein
MGVPQNFHGFSTKNLEVSPHWWNPPVGWFTPQPTSPAKTWPMAWPGWWPRGKLPGPWETWPPRTRRLCRPCSVRPTTHHRLPGYLRRGGVTWDGDLRILLSASHLVSGFNIFNWFINLYNP